MSNPANNKPTDAGKNLPSSVEVKCFYALYAMTLNNGRYRHYRFYPVNHSLALQIRSHLCLISLDCKAFGILCTAVLLKVNWNQDASGLFAIMMMVMIQCSPRGSSAAQTPWPCCGAPCNSWLRPSPARPDSSPRSTASLESIKERKTNGRTEWEDEETKTRGRQRHRKID